MVSNSLVVKSPQKRLACLFFSDILLATWLDVSWSFWKLDHRGAKSDQTSDSQITRECQGKQVGDSTISHLFINTDYDGGAWYYCVTSEGSDTINKVIISICSFCTTEQKLTFCPKAQLLWGSKDPQKSEKFLYQKLGHLHTNQRQPQCLEITKKVSIFTPKIAQIATVDSIVDFLARKFKSIEYEILWNETLFVFSNTVQQPPLWQEKKLQRG
mgnify:CR=1 FL=1